MRGEQRSLLVRKTMNSSVKEEDENDEGDGATAVGRLPGMVSNLLIPPGMSGIDKPKAKPKPLLRGATVCASAIGPLKEILGAKTPAPAPKPTLSIPAFAASANDDTRTVSTAKSFNRDSPDSSQTRLRANSDESDIPGPPSGTPPSPSRIDRAALKESTPLLKISEAAAAVDPVDSMMKKFGTLNS